MNSLIITRSILNEIYDDKTFTDEVAELINSLIDSELQKEEPDFDFIDECVNVLIEAQNGNFADVIPFIAENKFNDSDKKRKVLSVFAACAVILLLSIGAVAINHTAEKKNEETTTELTTESTTVQTTTTSTTASSTNASSTTSSSEIISGNAVKLKLNFSSGFKSDYKSVEDFSLKGITVIVEYSNGAKKNVNINDCKIIKSKNFGESSFVEKVTVEYDGVSSSFFVTFSGNVTGFEITQYTGFDKSTEATSVPELESDKTEPETETVPDEINQ